MSERKHKLEMQRYASSQEGTEVWYKHDNGAWRLVSNPFWNEDITYIIDDEWAKLRKAQIDGKTIERRISIDSPFHIVDIEKCTMTYIDNYRIKKEPAYYYRWERLTAKRIQESGLIKENSNLESKLISSGWRRIESSRRTWDDT